MPEVMESTYPATAQPEFRKTPGGGNPRTGERITAQESPSEPTTTQLLAAKTSETGATSGRLEPYSSTDATQRIEENGQNEETQQ